MSIAIALALRRSHTFNTFQQGVEALLNFRQFYIEPPLNVEPLFSIVGLSHYYLGFASKAKSYVPNRCYQSRVVLLIVACCLFGRYPKLLQRCCTCDVSRVTDPSVTVSRSNGV